MKQNFCTNCNVKLDKEVKFCPHCGNKTILVKKQKSNKNSDFSIKDLIKNKKFIIIASIVLGLVIVGIVVFSIFQTLNLNSNANVQKNTVYADANSTYDSSKIGNLSGNICAGAKSVFADSKLYFANDKGLFVTDNFDVDEIKSENCTQIEKGKFSSLNFFNECLYCIDEKNNSIIKVTGLGNEDEPYVETVYQENNGHVLKSFGISSGNVHMLCKIEDCFVLHQCSLANFKSIGEVFKTQASDAWLFVSESDVRVVCQEQGSWNVYKKDASRYISGNGTLQSIGFAEEKAVALNKSDASLNRSNIVISDSTGNSTTASLECSANKILASGNCVFVQSDNSHLLWFNTDTNMTHDIYIDNQNNNNIVSMNINAGKLCVFYSNGNIALKDINSLT